MNITISGQVRSDHRSDREPGITAEVPVADLEMARPTALVSSSNVRRCHPLGDWRPFASSSARSFISWEPAVGWYLCRRICLPSFEAVGSLWHLALSSVPRRRSRGWRALPASRCTASARSHPDRLPAAAPPLARRAGRRRAAPDSVQRGEQDASRRGGRGGPTHQTDTKN